MNELGLNRWTMPPWVQDMLKEDDLRLNALRRTQIEKVEAVFQVHGESLVHASFCGLRGNEPVLFSLEKREWGLWAATQTLKGHHVLSKPWGLELNLQLPPFESKHLLIQATMKSSDRENELVAELKELELRLARANGK